MLRLFAAQFVPVGFVMRKSLLVLLALLPPLSGCQTTTHAGRGAGLGALTGGLAGAAIGRHNGDTTTGALLGTAVGALTGAAIGDAVDQDAARTAMIEERIGRQLAGAATLNDVIAMSHAGLGDDVITTHIRANGVAQPPGVNDLITLRNAGVSDAVVTALQQTPPPVVRGVAPAPPAVIVQEYEFFPAPFPPPVFCPPRHWRPHHHHHHGVHWGISFGR